MFAEKEKMISAVIPVYNAEKYISRCLDSLIFQTFTDWEAVCVDDGSTDGSAGILDRYAAADPRIRVAHVENGGVSRARNTALEMVRGEFILFVDSDDFIHPQTMEICLAMISRSGSDLVAFTYDRAYRTRNMVRQLLRLGEGGLPRFRKYDVEKIVFMDTEDIYSVASEYSRPAGIDPRWAVKHCQPWRCLYRSSAVGGLRFHEGIIYEDFPWWGAVLLKVRKSTVINLPLYYYYPNLRSYVNSSPSVYKIESLRTALREAEDLYSRGGATPYQRRIWEEHFLVPFRNKLKGKEKKAGMPVE